MLPLQNSPFNRSNQVQTEGTMTPFSAAQQVMPSKNHFQANSTPYSAQVQSPVGMINPPIGVPVNNSTAFGIPNQFFNLQNGMPLLGQCYTGFTTPMNPIQQPNQMFAHGCFNPPQHSSQNAGFSNGQPFLRGPIQNINQFVQMPMPNYGQVANCNLPLPNQVCPALGPQNPTFVANPHFAMVHSNSVMQPPDQDQHNTTEQLQGVTPLPHAFGFVPQQQTPKNFHPPGIRKSQGNIRNGIGAGLQAGRQDSQHGSCRRNIQREILHKGFQKNESNKNVKGKFGFKHGGTGFKNESRRKSGLAGPTNNSQVEQRRLLPLIYTEKEIVQWREARRKNYPSKANIEKKLMKKLTEPKVTDEDAKLRCQQLKEILKRQAELGCEVAEIPSHYLSDSEKPIPREIENKTKQCKKGEFRNKFNKRGQENRNDRFPKKPKFSDRSANAHKKDVETTNKDSSREFSLNKRQPTLLQKLLSREIKRDKSHLLQVFRFMTMNSFFKDLPEKPLRFSKVIVKEAEFDCDNVEGKSLSSGEGDSKITNSMIGEEPHYLGDDNGGGGGEANYDKNGKYVGQARPVCFDEGTEEGEIID
ncbi:hypothetical protein NMG60_11033113 [Bertholletia excelsa]